MSTADKIDRSEHLYAGEIKKRWKLIEKYGPRVTDVVQ